MSRPANLVVGIIIMLFALYYWIFVGHSGPITDVPMLYRFTFRLFPYLDIIITAIGVWFIYSGLKKSGA